MKHIATMALTPVKSEALYLLFKDGEVLNWLGSPDSWERIGNDGRIVSMVASSIPLAEPK